MPTPVENGPVIVLGNPISHEAFGQLVGVSRQAISKMVSDGRLPAEGSAGTLLHAYCRQLREVAAGRASAAGGGLDLVQERAALARAQRKGIEMKNAVARQEYAPVGLIGDVLATASSAVVDRMDQFESLLRKMCPDIPDEMKQVVMKVMSDARNEWVSHTVKRVAEHLASQPIGTDDDDLYDPADPASAADG